MSRMEEEFEEFDQTGSWIFVFQKIRNDASLKHDYTWKDARRTEFRNRNRYRDVNPYDHSRVQLNRDGIDYINASLVQAPEANRSYILTQGPLPSTAGHFWLMVWEQNSHAVLMLNRVIEKGQMKCFQYFPMGAETEDQDEMVFEDVDLKVTFVAATDYSYYIVRTLELTDLRSGAKKEVLQFHYTTWPDFGVPQSPAAFLNFLMAVRRSGALEADVGPAVIHCSAGIGRSGTFCLVDTCLILIEKAGTMDGINLREVLMDMRKYRMGLIQTADQLRFSYLAILEGAKKVLSGSFDSGFSEFVDTETSAPPPPARTSSLQRRGSDDEDDEDEEELPPPLPPRRKKPSDTDSNNVNDLSPAAQVCEADLEKERLENVEVRRRKREERIKNTAEQIARMKRKQQESEIWKKRKESLMSPTVIGVTAVGVVFVGILIYHYFSS